MFLDVCLRIWSFLGQTPVPGAAEAVEAASQTAAAPTEPKFNWVRYLLMVVYYMVCGLLIFVVMQQEQKSGGLQGMLGGGSTASDHKYQGKKSAEENLRIISNWLAVAFIVLSIAVSYVMK